MVAAMPPAIDVVPVPLAGQTLVQVLHALPPPCPPHLPMPALGVEQQQQQLPLLGRHQLLHPPLLTTMCLR